MVDKPVIYVVDDDAAVRESIVALIGIRGVRTASFASAEQFLQEADLSAAGCLVLDIRMPGMSGLDLLAHLRTRGSQLPVVVVTAHADVPTAVKAMKQGAETFLEKPCSEDELWIAIEEVLHRDRQQQSQQRQAAEIKSRLTELTRDELEARLPSKGCKTSRLPPAWASARDRRVARSTIMKKMQANFSELVMAIGSSTSRRHRPKLCSMSAEELARNWRPSCDSV
jgi:two-component system response regulator FixJ